MPSVATRRFPEGFAGDMPTWRRLLYPSRPWARSSTVEHLTLNQRVLGSNPSGLTNSPRRQAAPSRRLFGAFAQALRRVRPSRSDPAIPTRLRPALPAPGRRPVCARGSENRAARRSSVAVQLGTPCARRGHDPSGNGIVHARRVERPPAGAPMFHRPPLRRRRRAGVGSAARSRAPCQPRGESCATVTSTMRGAST